MLFDMEGRLHINKHSRNADTSALYAMNHPQTNKQKSQQWNNIHWYNPPVSKNVSTNIGHRFFALVDKHFLKDHKLRRIFNCNTIKISYSCMNNTKQIINNHKKRILN